MILQTVLMLRSLAIITPSIVIENVAAQNFLHRRMLELPDAVQWKAPFNDNMAPSDARVLNSGSLTKSSTLYNERRFPPSQRLQFSPFHRFLIMKNQHKLILRGGMYICIYVYIYICFFFCCYIYIYVYS